MYHWSLRPAFGHHGLMTPVLDLQLDRTTKTPLTDQIRNGITVRSAPRRLRMVVTPIREASMNCDVR